MKLSARNILKGKVVTIIRGVTTHNVKIDIGQGIIITSSVTAVAIKDLKLKRGDDAYAIIKSSEVIIGKDQPVHNPAFILSARSIITCVERV